MTRERKIPRAIEAPEAGPTDSGSDDVTGHGLLHEGFQRPPATSRNADRTPAQGCRTPGRSHPNRRETR